jgi:hypothetical protein
VEHLQLLGPRGDDRPALQGGHGLDRAEAEADEVAGGPDHAPVVAGADGVGGVLDHPQAVPLGDPVDLVQPPDQPGEVADHDGPGAL